MQLTTFESRASSTRKDRASTLCLLSEYTLQTKKYLKRELEKIKFVVKLNLFDMNIRCYITLKKVNQREPNPSLLRGSQALKPLRYNALLEKRPNKRVYKQLYKL